MISSGEYGGGLFAAWLSIISLGSKYWHWAASAGRAWEKTRGLAIVAIVVCIALAYFVANDMRGKSSWSHIPAAWNAMLIASDLRTLKLSSEVISPILPYPFPAQGKYAPYIPPVSQKVPKQVTVTLIHPTHLAGAVGENTSAFVLLDVNADKAMEVKMYQVSAIKPFYLDGLQQGKLENDLWGDLIQSEKSGGQPLQLPFQNKDVGIPLIFRSLTQPLLDTINTEQGKYYFLCQLFRKDGKHLLDVCFLMDKQGAITYCRYHNGS